MSSLHMDEKFDGTFRQLFDTIERCTEQGSTDRLQTLLEELGGQLALGLEAFGEPSNAARSKIVPKKPISLGSTNTFTLTTDEIDIICHLSDVLQLNELQCAILWNAQKKHNPTILSGFLLQWKNQKQDPLQHIDGYSQVFQFFTQAYFEDRLSLLQSLSSLLRLSQQYDDDKPCSYVSIAFGAINNLMSGGDTIDGQLIKQFNRLVRTCVPVAFESSPQLTQLYTYQILKEERALLEILIIYYISRPCPASRLLSIYQEFEASRFGTEQTFGNHLNIVGQTMCSEVTNLCGLLSAQLLQQATATLTSTDGIDREGLKSSPEIIISLNHIMSFLGDIQVHALPLLAWADFLQCLEPLVCNDDGASYGKVKNMLDGTLQSDTKSITSLLLSSKDRPRSIHHGRLSASMATSNRAPIIEQGPDLLQRYIGRAVKLNAPEYIYALLSSSQICTEEDVNKLAYHVILYELLSRFCYMVNLSYLGEDKHSTIIQNFCILFQNEPELCEQFWNITSQQAVKESTFMDTDSSTNPALGLSTLLLDPKSGAFPKKFTDLIRLLISVCGESSLSADTAPVQNVNRYLMPDGWHALVGKLIQFLEGDRNATSVPDACAILQLLEKVLLSSNSSMINDLMGHVELIDPSNGTNGPFVVSLLCKVIASNSSVHDCSVEILTSAIKCLTILLPYYPAELWIFVGTSSLFPRPLESDPLLSLGFSKVPTRALGNRHPAQIDHIIASVECEIGKYSILLALLDFIGGLIKNVKQHWWSSQNEEGKNEQYKAEILSGYLHYLTSHVLPYYSGWRYKSVYDRYLIGSKMTTLFIDVDRFFKFDNNGTGCGNDRISYDDKGKVAPTMANVRAVMHYRFLKDEYAIRFYLSPLLDVMSNGAWMAEGLFTSNRIKEAQQAETLVKLTFLFVKSLLLQQLANKNADNASSETGLLEKAMLNHRSGNSNKMDFLFRLAQLIRYSKHHSIEYSDVNTLPTIPILATNVIALLCLSVSRWKVVPNFVQYLGDTDQVQSIIKSYLAIAKDPSHSESLLTSIWQMLSLLVETQPSLALLFMECGDAIMPSPKSAVKLLDQQNNNSKKSTVSVTFSLPSDSGSGATGSGTTSNESAVRAAVELLNDWQSLSITKPTVLSNVLRFLTTFWQSAFDHYAMVQRTRSDNALWQALEAILLNPSNMDFLSGDGSDLQRQQQQKQQQQQLMDDVELDDSIMENVLYVVDKVISDTNQSVRRKCCMDLNRAFIMRLISFEIQLTAGSQVAQGIKLSSGAAVVGDKLPAGLKNILFKMGEPKKLEWMRQCFIKDDFDPLLSLQVRKKADDVLTCGPFPLKTDNINSLLQMVPNVGFGDDTNNTPGQTRQYGASYLYDLPLAVSRSASLYRKATETEREYLRNQQNESNTTEIMVTPEVRTMRMVKQTCVQFISDVCSSNYNWSMVDAQMMLLQSFKTLMETSSGHASEVIWHTKSKSSLYTFVNDLVDQVIEDIKEPMTSQEEQLEYQQRKEYKYNPQEQQNSITLKRHQYIISLIRALTEDWISSNRVLIMDKSASQRQLKWDYIKEAISLVKKFCHLLQRENLTLINGVNDLPPAIRQRPLLESILLCIRTMHTSSSSGEESMRQDNDGLKDDLTQLLVVICESFSSTVQNATTHQRQQRAAIASLPDDKSEECIKDVTVLLALLGELVKSNEQQGMCIPVDVWLPVFEKHGTITTLLKVAYHGMVLVVDEMESQTKLDSSGLHNIMVSPYAENAMYFMVALSNIPRAAKALRDAGVMDLLCNNALSRQLEQGNLDTFVRFGGRSTSEIPSTTIETAETGTAAASGSSSNSNGKSRDSRTAEVGGSGFVERHPLHVLWCQMLNVLGNMIRITGSTDDGLLRLGVLFIQKYSKQVDRSFAIANGANDSLLGLVPSESLSSPLMTEIELLTTILFCLAKQLNRVSPYAVNIFMAFKNCGLSLVKRYLYHFTHPNHMQAQLFPADQDEKLQSQISISKNEPVAFSGSPQLTQQQQGTMTSTGEQYVSQLMYSTTQRAARIARNILGSIVLLTEAETILVEKDTVWPFGNTILSPDTRASSSSIVSFGTMKEWTMACLQLMQRTSSWVSECEKQQKDTILSPSISQPTLSDLQALLSTLEFSIVLLTTQTILWLAKPDLHQDERKMIANDNLKSLVNLMDKIYTSLKKLELDMQQEQQSIKTTTIKDEIRLFETHIIGPLKHLLITRFFEST